MINSTELEEMRETLSTAEATPAREICYRLLDEIHELGEVLHDLQSDKSCFCSMPVHMRSCRKALDWLEALTEI